MQRPYKGKFLLLPVAFIALMVSPSAFAQETTAGIQGTVKDPSGASVANATIEVSGASLIGVRKVKTDESGVYRITALPPGNYTLTVTVPGFRTFKQGGIALAVGRLPNLDVKLEVGAVAETVEVTSTVTTVDTTTSNVAIAMEREALQNLPTGRSFQSVIPFAAGARQEPLQSSRTARDNGFQIDGASDSENVYMIDGVNTTDNQNGGVGKNFQMDFIQEVQIKSSGYEAEYGGALGGVVNAIPKHGSNEWHGGLMAYIRTNSLNAIDACASGYTSGGVGTFLGYSTVCGLRLNPTLPSLSSARRLDGTPEYYIPAKDQRHIMEPGFQIGGPLVSNKLWLFSSYIPDMDTIHRTTSFTAANPGARTLTSSYIQHNMYNRLDYGVTNSLRVFGAWNYAYSRTQGQLGAPNSANGQQLNTGASTDPNTLRSDAGTVNPLSTYSFGGDWTPTARLVITTRYGYYFSNNEQRGTPSGTRYIYDATVNAASKDLAGQAFPTSTFNTSGYSNIPSNLATAYDAFKRHGLTADASYFGRFLGGNHTFKAGYFWQRQSEDVLSLFQGGVVDLYWGTSYVPVTNATACNGIMASNLSNFGQNLCQGKYGYFVIGSSTVTNTGATQQTAHAFYLQDAWNVGHGLTLNLGIRFDQEHMPAYDPTRFPSLDFGWGQKIAPRIGGAYDLLHNGKVKIFASYGQFYDLMKMGLARGSFGSDFWHQCVYALDDPNFASITPTAHVGGGCPASGPAPGVSTGRFIENIDWRATHADPRDPGIDTGMKPMKQHEYTAGVNWAINSSLGLEARFTRKILDMAIEDMSITDNLGYYIGNPGSKFGDVLHRPTFTPNDNGDLYYNTVPFCAECPPVVPAIRRYNGLELRLTKRSAGNFFWMASYSYSKLTGNYAGLTNTDPTDANGGRHSPNNGRAFDLPTMTYLPSGKIDDGPLSTDRPNTGKVYAYYRLKWAGMETNFGLTEVAYQGTPMGTCLPVVGTSSACQYAEGRGNWANFTRDPATGNFVSSGVVQNARTDNLVQTDLSIHHELRPSKTREQMRMSFEIQAQNLFNQRAKEAFIQGPVAAAAGVINPVRPARFSGDPQTDWNKVMTGYSYVDALNGTGAFGGAAQQPAQALASRYGLAQTYQGARNMRISVRFVF